MHHQLKLYLVDTFANYTFFIPIVSVVLWFASHSIEVVISNAIAGIPIALVSSRFFTIYLTWLRNKLVSY